MGGLWLDEFAVKYLLILILLFLNGCTQNEYNDGRFYDGPLSSNELVGVWIITTTSLHELRKLGYEKYTNKIDHVIILMPKGVCIYRTFDRYMTKEMLSFFYGDEREAYNQIPGKSKLRPSGINEACTWYSILSNENVKIGGPYRRDSKQSGMEINRWPIWLIKDSSENIEPYEDEYGVKHRYRILYDNPAFHGSTYSYIGSDARGFYLWQPANNSPNGSPLTITAKIMFRKCNKAIISNTVAVISKDCFER